MCYDFKPHTACCVLGLLNFISLALCQDYASWTEAGKLLIFVNSSYMEISYYDTCTFCNSLSPYFTQFLFMDPSEADLFMDSMTTTANNQLSPRRQIEMARSAAPVDMELTSTPTADQHLEFGYLDPGLDGECYMWPSQLASEQILYLVRRLISVLTFRILKCPSRKVQKRWYFQCDFTCQVGLMMLLLKSGLWSLMIFFIILYYSS